MKIPEYIKKAIRDKAKAEEIALKNDAVIRAWFQKNQMQNVSVFDAYIDSTETGNDPEGFISYIEKEQFSFGNDYRYDEDE